MLYKCIHRTHGLSRTSHFSLVSTKRDGRLYILVISNIHALSNLQTVDNEQNLLGQRHFKVLITDNLQLDRTRTTLCRSQEQELQLEGRQFSPARLAHPSPGNQMVVSASLYKGDFSEEDLRSKHHDQVPQVTVGDAENKNGLKNSLEMLEIPNMVRKTFYRLFSKVGLYRI